MLKVTLLVSQRSQLSQGLCSPALVVQPLLDFQALPVEPPRLLVLPLHKGNIPQLLQDLGGKLFITLTNIAEGGRAELTQKWIQPKPSEGLRNLYHEFSGLLEVA